MQSTPRTSLVSWGQGLSLSNWAHSMHCVRMSISLFVLVSFVLVHYRDCGHLCCNKEWTKQVLIKIASQRLGGRWLILYSDFCTSMGTRVQVSWTHIKNQVWHGGICNPSAEGREGYDVLPSQSASIRFRERTWSQEIRWRDKRWLSG